MDTWYLAGSWSAAEQNGRGQHSMVVIRKLDEIEQTSVLQAMKLVEILTTGSGWNDFATAWRVLEGELTKLSVSPSALDGLVANFIAATTTLKAHFARVAALLDSEQRESFAAEVEAIGWSSMHESLSRGATETLVEIVEVEHKPGRVAPFVLLTSAGRRVLGAHDGQPVHALGPFVQIVNVCAVAHAHLLIQSAPSAKTASAKLRVLASEVFDGVAILTRGADNLAAPGPTKLDHREIPIAHLYALAQAIREAERLLASLQPPSEQSVDQTVKIEIPTDGEASTPSQESADNDSPSPVHQPVADFVALVDHAIKMPDALERDWSNALARTLTDTGVSEGLVRFNSLLASHLSAVESNEILEEWPLNAAAIERLVRSVPPTVEDEIATHIYVVRSLAVALTGIREPGALEINVATGQGVRFWESGGFARVRSLSLLLLRSLENIGLVSESGASPQALPAGIEAQLRRDPISVLLDCASRARAFGFPEAALLYLHLAISQLKAENEKGVALDHLESLDDAITGMAGGVSLPLSRVIPLVEALLPAVSQVLAARGVEE